MKRAEMRRHRRKARVLSICVIAGLAMAGCAARMPSALELQVERLEEAATRADAAAREAEQSARRATDSADRAESAVESRAAFAKGIRRVGGSAQPVLPVRKRPAARYARPAAGRVHPPSGAAPAGLASPEAEMEESQSSRFAGEELWIIARRRDTAAREAVAHPSLLAKAAAGDRGTPLPLQRTTVQADVAAHVASVQVSQDFHNPYSENIEAVYTLPLPQDAAVNDFVMTIGERHIRGIIREREDAEQIYEDARRQGYVASLLNEEGPNLFTQSIANLEPDHDIHIEVRYLDTLHYDRGSYELALPAFDSSAALSITVDIDAGTEITEVGSPTHPLQTTEISASRRHVEVVSDGANSAAFVLRYRVATRAVTTAVLTQRDAHGGYFTLLVHPPDASGALPRMPLELVFLLDCSGSMSGHPFDTARTVIRQALAHLTVDDTFRIVRTGAQTSQLATQPLAATAENLRRADDYLAEPDCAGEAMMDDGIDAVFAQPEDAQRRRILWFLSDGFIGNDAEMTERVQTKIGATRIVAFAIGSSVNPSLFHRLAMVGRGGVVYVQPGDETEDAVAPLIESLSHPVLSDLTPNWGSAQVDDVYPKQIPDLLIGRPIVLTGHFVGPLDSGITLTGRATGATQDTNLPVAASDPNVPHPAIASLWARMKIAALEDAGASADASSLLAAITSIALEHSIVSPYTAFVVVDSSTHSAGDTGATIVVPAGDEQPDESAPARNVP